MSSLLRACFLLGGVAVLLAVGDAGAGGAHRSRPYSPSGSNWEIFVMNADGTGQVNVTQDPAEDTFPAWSPDGTKIAFTSWRGVDGNPEIFVMRPDGSGLVNLTEDLAEDYDPSWSPDGTKIVFARSTGGDYFHLFSM